ncbi:MULTISPECIES: hypothetical protein [Bacteroidales]|nr:hypothetical protein [Parabacteroides distasonis]
MREIKNEYLHMSKNEYLHENNQNLNKNGYGNNGGENGGFTGGIKKAPGERPLCRPARDGRDREDAFNPAVG